MVKPFLVIVDDEVDITENFKAILCDDYDVSTFNSPKEFHKYLDDHKNRKQDFVLSDYKMPGGSGVEMIKEAQKKGFSFPFIILSGFLDKQAVMEGVDAGAYRFLEKPCEFSILYDALEELSIEHDIIEIRKEIRTLVNQLKELYSGIRMIMEQYIPTEILNHMVVETVEDKVTKKTSFEDTLVKLETRLEKLLQSEKILNDVKKDKTKL